MSSIDERAKLTPVYYDRGVFYSDDDANPTKIKKFSRAPFDIIQIEVSEGKQKEIFIAPKVNVNLGSPESWGDTFNSPHDMEGFGYLTGEIFILEKHRLGAYSSGSDLIWDCFELNYV